MIQTRKTHQETYFFTICTNCGTEGPYADRKMQASELATEEGWTSDTIFPGGEMVERYYCPECSNTK